MENLVILVTILLLSCNSDQDTTVQFHLDDSKERSERGKTHLERLESRTKLPSHSNCWREAVASLRSSCIHTNDVGQSHLAIKLTNCHLQRSGLQTFPCEDTDSIEKCTKPMAKDSIAYIVYTEFFTHVTDICHYLQSELWREETSNTISKLTKTSSNIANKLDKSIKQQDYLLQGQDVSLKNQEEMIKNENYLKSSLKDSAETVQMSFARIREEAKRQRDVYTDTFNTLFQSVERLTKLQNMLLGEFISLQSVAFYLICIIVSYLFTSTLRTAGARLPLFVLLTVLIFAERCLTSFIYSGDGDRAASTEEFHVKIWFLRKLFLLVMTLVFGYVAISYQDLNKINNQMLQSIEHHILEIKKLQLTHHETPQKRGAIGGPSTVSKVDGCENERRRRLIQDESFSVQPETVKDFKEVIDLSTTSLNFQLTDLSDDEDGVTDDIKSSSLLEDFRIASSCKNGNSGSVNTSVSHIKIQKESTKRKRTTKKPYLETSTVTYSLRRRSRNSILTSPMTTPSTTPLKPRDMNSTNHSKPSSSKSGRRKTKTKTVDARSFFSSDDEDYK